MEEEFKNQSILERDLIEEMETLLKHAPVSIFDVLFTNRIGRYSNISKSEKQLNHEK